VEGDKKKWIKTFLMIDGQVMRGILGKWIQPFPILGALTRGGIFGEMGTTVSHVRSPDKGRDIWGNGYNRFPC